MVSTRHETWLRLVKFPSVSDFTFIVVINVLYDFIILYMTSLTLSIRASFRLTDLLCLFSALETRRRCSRS